MANKVHVATSGIGFLELLTLAFIVLKLTKVINWSWWWVLMPILGQVAAIFLFIVVLGIIVTVQTLWDTRRRW